MLILNVLGRLNHDTVAFTKIRTKSETLWHLCQRIERSLDEINELISSDRVVFGHVSVDVVKIVVDPGSNNNLIRYIFSVGV